MTGGRIGLPVVALSRTLSIGAVVLLIGLLPWLSGRSPEYTILRARYADLEATPEALAAVRAELGLDRGPLVVFGDWIGGVLRGDLGTSWITNRPVLPGTLEALGVSLSLMGFAIVVALVLAAALCAPAVVRGVRGRPNSGSGALATAFTALPEFLLAAVLLVVGAVWTGWFPPFGWTGPEYAVLPALALGLPAGGLIGRLLSEAVTAASGERWLRTWRTAGFPSRTIALAVLRRALPSVLAQIGFVLIGLTGGAVAVEEVFAIPGLGRATLGAASAQDIPALQAGVLALLAIALIAGAAAGLSRALLLGPALRLGALPVPPEQRVFRRRALVVPAVAALGLALILLVGLGRDPVASTATRLAAPSLALPFGADASGRDLLARVASGAVTTLGTAALVTLVVLIVGVVVGLFPRAAIGPSEVANAAPPIIADLIVAALLGPSIQGAALAVAAVSWAPLAAHTAALVAEARAQPHVTVLPVLGVGRTRALLQHILPAVLPPVIRHAVLRIPGIALALAALGFLGLGPRQPTPEWGLVLAEGIGYVERAPWAVLAPAGALVAAAVLAVSLSALGSVPLRRRPSPSGRLVATAADQHDTQAIHREQD